MGGVAPKRFGGKDIYLPGYHAVRNIEGAAGGGAAGSVIVLVGPSEGGTPHNATDKTDEEKINWLSGENDIRKILRAGDGYYGCKFALAPSTDPDIGRPSRVGFIRVDPATQSTYTLQVAAADTIDLTSTDYGLHTAETRIKVSAGTVGKKFQVKKFDARGNEVLITIDNISQIGFKLNYTIGTGAATAATAAVDHDGNFTTTITTEAGDNLTLALSTYDTLGKLVAAINSATAKGIYTATLVDDSTFPTAKLDDVTGVVIWDTVTGDMHSDCWEFIDRVTESGEYVKASLHAAADHVPPDNVGYVHMTGGSNGVTLQSHWEAAFALAEKFPEISYMAAVTSDSAVHATLSDHCTTQNDIPNKGERVGYCGAARATADTALKSATVAINNMFIAYVGDSIWRYNIDGKLTEFGPYFAACALAGMKAGSPKIVTPTWKTITTVKLTNQRSYNNRVDMVRAGVQVFFKGDKGYMCERAVTSYQGTNLIANEQSMVDTVLAITKDHRAYIESLFIGKPGVTGMEKSVETASKNRLLYYTETVGWLRVDPATGDSFRNHTITLDGDTFEIEYEGTVTSPINNVLSIHNFVVTGRASA